MDSEADLSLNFPELISSRPKRGCIAAATWAHTCTAQNGEAEFIGQNHIMYCHHYPQDLSYNTTVTTNFRKHLISKHKISVKEDLSVL